jgi:hypothetical protein
MVKKVLIPGLVCGLVILVVGMAVSMLIQALMPGLAAEYQNPALFRPWSDPLMSIYFAFPFLLGLALAWVWDRVKGLLPGAIWQRALGLTLGYFLISTIPGMTITYSSFPVSLAMVLSWTVSSVVQVYCGTLVLAKMNG